MLEDWVELAGAVLPGDVPWAVTCASLCAPSGAGDVEAVPAGVVSGVIAVDDGAVLPGETACDIEPCAIGAMALEEGAVLPGEAPGAVCTGSLGEPVGAGDGVAVWARAMLAVIKMAAVPSRSERMMVSLRFDLGLIS